jgi:alpha-3'-ketoglucosidase
MSPSRPAAVSAALALLVAGCGGHYAAAGPAGPERPNTLTSAESKEGWRLLFDGSTTTGWRAYDADTMPSGWKVVDGALTRVDRAGDIITTDTFRDFELSVDWNISPGGNSGIFYRGALGSEAIYYSAPEMQVLDDARHPDGQSPLTSAGADYGLYAAPRGVVKPAGEWNTARVVVRGNHVEHWLNGKKIVTYELGSVDWVKRVADSKFKQWPQYGKAPQGYIGLQDHGDRVAFRNIKVRVLR